MKELLEKNWRREAEKILGQFDQRARNELATEDFA
jgi:hypothetical protein